MFELTDDEFHDIFEILHEILEKYEHYISEDVATAIAVLLQLMILKLKLEDVENEDKTVKVEELN